MKYYDKPHFVVKNNAQKGGYSYKELLDDKTLEDICYKITGQKQYTIEFDEEGYNKGRLAMLYYKDNKNYVSLSIKGKVEGRNYFFQSVTTAIIKYYKERAKNDKIYFYFLDLIGNIETPYYIFMYRLMATVGVYFLNADLYLKNTIVEFVDIEDLVTAKEKLRNKNVANKSTYVTRQTEEITEVYAKTYGANKKESVLIAMASSILSKKVVLYEICEENLNLLPKPDKKVLRSLGNIEIITSDLEIERYQFEKNNSLRSPKFIYNLLDRLGPKKCLLCDCEIPELIEGAHIWEVKDIKQENKLSEDEKLKYAIDGNNGMWLCVGHHRMYDRGLIRINNDGSITIKDDLKDKDKEYISKITVEKEIADIFINEQVLEYLNIRNLDL